MPTDQTMEQEFEAVPTIPPKGEKPKRKIILAVGGLLITVVVVVFWFLFLASQKPSKENSPPIIPSPIPTAIETISHPSSPYATDAAVLKIEEDLKSLDQELQSTDLKEAGLNPPVLDMEVK